MLESTCIEVLLCFEMFRSRVLEDSLRNVHLFLIDRRVVKGGLEA